MSTPRVLVVGEALVDIVRQVDGTTAEHPGGSPANVALGLGRLGRRVDLLTRLGRDRRGETITELLRGSAVHLIESSYTDAPTSTATATIDPAGVAGYEFDIDWTLPTRAATLAGAAGGDADDVAVLHTGSIGAFLHPGGQTVLDLVREAADSVTVTYDPNARPRLMGAPGPARRWVEQIVRHAALVKVSDEDLLWLTPDRSIEEVADAWLALGPAVVVVTRGPNGAVARCAAGRVEVPGLAVDVVDTVGAGDSFMSALIDYLLTADLMGPGRRRALTGIGLDDVSAMLEHAVAVSAIVCARPGADPPWRRELG
jgi:fructokinase